MRRKASVFVFLTVAALTAGLPGTAAAGVTSTVEDGVLVVTGDDERNLVVIECGDAGGVTVNGDAPGSGSFPCEDLTGIRVGVAGGDDSVFLDDMRPADFPALASAVVDGGPGDEWLVDSRGAETLVGGPGEDVLDVRFGGDDVLRGGTGVDLLKVSTRGDLTLTDERMETARGTARLRSVDEAQIVPGGRGLRIDASGFRGHTLITTGAGDDTLIGGPANDLITSGPGDDRLLGNGGPDHLYAGDGNDVLRGGAGTDRLDGQAGRDDCDGGPGNDATLNCE